MPPTIDFSETTKDLEQFVEEIGSVEAMMRNRLLDLVRALEKQNKQDKAEKVHLETLWQRLTQRYHQLEADHAALRERVSTMEKHLKQAVMTNDALIKERREFLRERDMMQRRLLTAIQYGQISNNHKDNNQNNKDNDKNDKDNNNNTGKATANAKGAASGQGPSLHPKLDALLALVPDSIPTTTAAATTATATTNGKEPPARIKALKDVVLGKTGTMTQLGRRPLPMNSDKKVAGSSNNNNNNKDDTDKKPKASVDKKAPGVTEREKHDKGDQDGDESSEGKPTTSEKEASKDKQKTALPTNTDKEVSVNDQDDTDKKPNASVDKKLPAVTEQDYHDNGDNSEDNNSEGKSTRSENDDTKGEKKAAVAEPSPCPSSTQSVYIYSCPVPPCRKTFAFPKTSNPPLDDNGQVSDKSAWSKITLGPQIESVRTHLRKRHADLARTSWPAGVTYKKQRVHTTPPLLPKPDPKCSWYACPMENCSDIFGFPKHLLPPLDHLGNVSDAEPWDLSRFGDMARQIRLHMSRNHQHIPQDQWPTALRAQIAAAEEQQGQKQEQEEQKPQQEKQRQQKQKSSTSLACQPVGAISSLPTNVLITQAKQQPQKNHREIKRKPWVSTALPRCQYICPMGKCPKNFWIPTKYSPPVDDQGNVTDSQPWDAERLGSFIHVITKHFQDAHADVSARDWPMAFRNNTDADDTETEASEKGDDESSVASQGSVSPEEKRDDAATETDTGDNEELGCSEDMSVLVL